MGERRGRGKQRSMNGGLMAMGSGGGTDCESARDAAGVSKGETGSTTVTEQQQT